MKISLLGIAASVHIALSALPAAAEPAVEARAVAGLRAPAEIVVDRNGIPHLYAGSERDAFFLQGYNAARDRLWHIDLWRKRGLGRLSASFGPAYVEQDRAARLLLYRGDMAAEWASYAPGAKAWTEAFVAGINAYVDEVGAGARAEPPEFALTGSAPERWAAEDVVRIRSHALASNVDSEVERARVGCLGGLEADRLRGVLEPPHAPVVPTGLDLCTVPEDVLAVYTLGTQPVHFDAAAGVRRVAVGREAAGEGSNNWVVSGARTETGRPILANDPHRAHALPSLRYLAHVEAPGLSFIGAGEPALPGVSLGHNGRVAFGLTIFPIDQQDLYAYDLCPDAASYRYRDRCEPFRVERETVEVKGEAPRPVELRFSRHGPLLKADAGRAWALRSVWSEPGTSAYFGSTWYLKARDGAAFDRVQDRWGAPPLNLLYADVDGAVGWAAAGRAPVRRGWDGLLPVPGDGRYEWDGFRRGAEMPSIRNPEQGWFATANEYNLPPGAEALGLSYEWSNSSRADRIKAALAADARVSVADSAALQTDVTSPFARRATALLAGLTSPDPAVAEALRRLAAWDHRITPDSVEATIFETWASRLLHRALVDEVTPMSARSALRDQGTALGAVAFLETETNRAIRDRVLLGSLSAAVMQLQAGLGPDMSTWRWGRLHQARFRSAAAAVSPSAAGALPTVGPFEVGGSSTTPMATSFGGTDFGVTAGASVRMVIDVGAWDRSIAINAPGQSGDPASPHYGDLAPRWARGEYVPLPFSRAAVDAAAETVIRLTPAR